MTPEQLQQLRTKYPSDSPIFKLIEESKVGNFLHYETIRKAAEYDARRISGIEKQVRSR